MSFNNHFDTLNVAPTFTFPAQQVYETSADTPRTSEDVQALPRQLNEWTSLDMLAFDQAGPSQLPVEDRRYPLGDEHMSSFLSLAVDMSVGDYPATYAVSSGPSDEAAWGAEMELEDYEFTFSAQDGFAAFRWEYEPLSSGLAQPSAGASEATEEGAVGGYLPPSYNDDPQVWPGASPLPLGDTECLQDTQTVSSSSGLSLAHSSDPAGPSSSPASRGPVAPSASVSPTTRSRGIVSDAVAGPSRLAPIAPRETAVQVEAPTVTELRRSSRKRTAPTHGYAEATTLPAPPQKKRKADKGAISKTRRSGAASASARAKQEEPVAGPSHHATVTVPKPSGRKARSVNAASKKDTKVKRPRRTRAQVDMHKVADMPTHACNVDGCAGVWNPYKHDDNKEHLEKHFDTADLEGNADLVCVFDACQAPIPGKDLLQHMEIHHIGLPYLCPIRCGWQSCRSSYQKQHMDDMHEGVHWV
ncbi:hypothetical protein VTO73DRAFT_11246 [Trametes versicolor]